MARGMIRKRGENWYIVYPLDGRKKWERIGPRKREAEMALASRLEAIRTGQFRNLKRMRFAEFSEEWIKNHVVPNTKGSTQEAYRSILKKHLCPYFGMMKLTDITTASVQGFLTDLSQERGLNPKTVGNIHVVLTEMLKHAIRWGYLHVNPAREAARPNRQKREFIALAPDQVQRFLRAVSPTYYPLFLTAVMTGLRRGELLALCWHNIDWERSVIKVERSLFRGQFTGLKSEESHREVAMPKSLARELKRLRLRVAVADPDFVFCTQPGRPLDPDNLVKREFLPALTRAGLPRIRFHDLRHTHASLLAAQGETAKFVQKQLGHASLATTMDIYVHLFPEDRREAAERLDETVFGTCARMG